MEIATWIITDGSQGEGKRMVIIPIERFRKRCPPDRTTQYLGVPDNLNGDELVAYIKINNLLN